MRSAKEKVDIAVAWINFKMYFELFSDLLDRKVELYVIVNSDVVNNKYKNEIELLKEKGMKINLLKIPGGKRFMHHKFCLVDEKRVLLGSYNWTLNASYNNFENLLVTDDKIIVSKVNGEFNTLRSMTSKRIRKLQQLNKCKKCKETIVNICKIEEDNNDTEVNVYSLCSCGENEIFRDFYSLSLYTNLISISEHYNHYLEDVGTDNEDLDYLETLFDHEIKKYLHEFSLQLNMPIHAIGVQAISTNEYFDAGEPFTKIIWKNRFAARLVEDEYYDI